MTTIRDAAIAIIIEVGGLSVGLWAIRLAFRHAKDLTNVVDKMQHQAEESRQAFTEMRGSLSTRYIGPFPLYFSEIVALIDKAQTSIDIFCDILAYGNFSSPPEFENYRHSLNTKLKDKKHKLTIEITCLSNEGRSALFKEQFFGHDADWEKKKHSDDFGPKLAVFLDSHSRHSDLDSLTADAFLGMLEQEDNLMWTNFLSGATITEALVVPINFWIIDRTQAIFTIPILSEEELEIGFLTTDTSLIKAFIAMRKRYNTSTDLLAAAPTARPYSASAVRSSSDK